MKDNKTPAVISPFKKRFLMQFKNNRKLFIAEFILQLLGIPLATLCFAKINIVLKDIQYQDDYYENYPFRTIDFYENIYIFGLGFLFLAILVGAVIALKNYSYLLKRNKTDMEIFFLRLPTYLSRFEGVPKVWEHPNGVPELRRGHRPR